MNMLTSFAFLGTPEIIMIGGVILVLFGGAKIPQLMRSLGRGMGEFHAGVGEGKQAMSDVLKGKAPGQDDETETHDEDKK